jgi:hypothetical protein
VLSLGLVPLTSVGGSCFALLLSQPGVDGVACDPCFLGKLFDVVVFRVFGDDATFEFGGYEVGAFFLPCP